MTHIRFALVAAAWKFALLAAGQAGLVGAVSLVEAAALVGGTGVAGLAGGTGVAGLAGAAGENAQSIDEVRTAFEEGRLLEVDEARTAFEEGRFLEAASLAEALGTSEGYTLAAQSLAVYGHHVAVGDDRKEFLERAMKLGEEAVRADSANAEAYYRSAHAAGRYAQSVGKITALRRGLAGKIRGLLEDTLAISPDFAEAHMALGSWHAGIASAGRIARFLYKGNRNDAVIHFERALELEPDSRVILLEFALCLPELDREGGRERAVGLLSKAAGLPVRDAYDGFIQRDVLKTLAELEEGG